MPTINVRISLNEHPLAIKMCGVLAGYPRIFQILAHSTPDIILYPYSPLLWAMIEKSTI